MAYIKTNIRIYVTSAYAPGHGNIYASEKFIAVENGEVLANGGNARELAAKFGVRTAGLAKDENGIVYRTTSEKVSYAEALAAQEA